MSRLFENHLDRHSDRHFFDRALDDITADPRAFIQIDPGRDVRNVFCESSEGPADHFTDHGEGEDVPAAADRGPLKFFAAALDASGAGAPDPRLAVATALHD